MNKTEASSCVDYITSLWAEWNPDNTLRDFWVHQLEKFENSIFRQAVSNFKITKQGSYKAPKLANILEIATKLRQSQRKEENKDEKPAVGYYLLGTHPDGRESKYHIYIKNSKTRGIHTASTMPNWEVIQKVAERHRERMLQGVLKGLYPAKMWEIIRGECFNEEIPEDSIPF